ncbi:YhgE/Pip domain-containing protein [Raoultibacter phocaeensis]|uniref:YhgE/Pip domain-containing protein n=1 Tax=Raoultibacter phocaeensis TaxID=2479841 RepID=UPI00111A0806|nr:YhgE/Pip domain-containing protein [Raoultibacter phocaeensis]
MAFKGLRFAGLEWKNVTASKVMWVVIAAIAIMPLLYGALYLAAFQDPYARLNTVPVAVVNEDAGAVIAGESRTLGNDVVDELKKTDDGLQWNFVSAEEAERGLEDGTYFMVCTIPSDFSASVASVDGDAPRRAQLKVQYNQSENMLASQIGETVWKEVRTRVSDTIATEYWTTVLDRVADSGKDIQTAAEGAGTLEDGLVTAQDGSRTITVNLGTLKDGALALDSGLVALANGASALENGTQSLVSGASELSSGTSRLASGADSVSAGASKLKGDGTSAVAAGARELAQQTAGLPAQTTQLNDGVQQVVGSMNALAGSIGADDSQSQSELIGGVNLVSGGLSQVSSGASALASGLEEASAGVAQVGGGIRKVNEAANAGLTAMASASTDAEKAAIATQYLNGIAGSTDSSSDLAVGTAKLQQKLTSTDPANPGAIAAAQSIAQQTGSGSQLAGGLAGIKSGLSAARNQIEASQPELTALTDGTASLAAAAPSLVDGIGKLDAGAGEVDRNMGALVSGASEVAVGADQVNDGASLAVAGANQLNAGASQLSAGAGTAKDGSAQIADGASQLEEGSSTLTDGLSDAVDGSGELSEKLAEGAKTAAEQATNISAKADAMADPVELANEYYTTVKNYGTGFAPYFMALGLWVGGLVAGFVFKPLNSRLILSGGNPVMVAFANFMPMAIFALIQATLLMVVLQFGLQLQIDNVPAFYAMGYLTAIVFAAIMQFLMAAFGFPGKFVAIILLMLQLTACAGTFPIQTTPPFFQAINPFMPMTYVVEAMRQIMTGLDYSVVAFDCFVLFAIGAVCFALTSVVAYRKRTVRMDDLHPVLQLG